MNGFQIKFLVMVSFLSYIIGYHHSPSRPSASRKIASVETTSGAMSINNWKALPCATEEEWGRLKSEYKIVSVPPGKLCDDSFLDRFAKLFKLIDSMEIKLSDKFPEPLRTDLSKPGQFVKRMTGTMNYDPKGDMGTAAYNQYVKRDIFLTANALVDPEPLVTIATLIHEARHSETTAATHVTCRLGDLIDGACDAFFDLGPKAGAYSYEVVFFYGLAKYGNIIKEEQERLQALALILLSARFNVFGAQFAVPYEIIVLLGKDGKLYYLHPFSDKIYEITHSFSEGESFLNIDYHHALGQLRLREKSGKIYRWKKGFVPSVYGKDLPGNFNWEDANSVYDAEKKASTEYFISTDGEMYRRLDNPETGEEYLEKMSTAATGKIQNVLSLGRKVLLRNSDKVLFEIKYPDVRAYLWNAPDGKLWDNVSPGVLFETVYGVASDGMLYRQADEQQKLRAIRADFIDIPLKKYFEGISFKVALTADNKVWVQDYATRKTRVITPADIEIQDIGMYRTIVPDEKFVPQKDVHERFKSDCEVVAYMTEPWLGLSLGVTAKGRIVNSSFRYANNCLEWDNLPSAVDGKIKTFSIESSGATSATKYFSVPTLILKGEKGEFRMQPYLH